MKKSFQFFALLIALFAATASFAQGAGKVSMRDFSFNAGNPRDWDVSRLTSPVPDGRVVLATFKANKTQVIAVVRGGLIAQVGIQPVGGAFQVINPSTAAGPCSTIKCTNFQIVHCFQQFGTCFCICGSWITTYPGN